VWTLPVANASIPAAHILDTEKIKLKKKRQKATRQYKRECFTDFMFSTTEIVNGQSWPMNKQKVPAIENNYEDLMRRALAEAQRSGNDVPVGALVINQGAIIGIGRNKREELNDPSAHAEIVAMREAAQHLGSWRLGGTLLVSTLEPCPMCAEAILQARVSTLVFGARDLVYGATGSAFNLYCPGRTFPLPVVIGGVLEDECRRLLQDYFREQRTKKER
jgi:tRNA(adenine34) deaminase